MEIKLDTRYDVSQPEEKEKDKEKEKEKEKEKGKEKEKEDEQGWTQSQQKALEAWASGGFWSVER